MFLELVSHEKNDLGNHLWRYVVTIIIVVIFYIIGQIPLAIVALIKAPDPQILMEFAEKVDFSIIGINSNIGLLLIILFFAFSLVGLLFSVKFIHRKKVLSVITTNPKIRWSRIFFAFLLWFSLSAIMEVLSYYSDPQNYIYNFDLELFIPLFFIAIFLLPIQTSFEEIFIRGYLMQGIGLIGFFRFIPLIITSILFGSLHIMNPEIDNFGLWTMMTFYVGFGLFLGIITLMDEGLEIPLGIHAANNIYASVLVTYSGGALQTDAIFKMTMLDKSFMFYSWLIMSVVFLIIVSHKYQWTNWQKLIGRINFKKLDKVVTQNEINKSAEQKKPETNQP